MSRIDELIKEREGSISDLLVDDLKRCKEIYDEDIAKAKQETLKQVEVIISSLEKLYDYGGEQLFSVTDGGVNIPMIMSRAKENRKAFLKHLITEIKNINQSPQGVISSTSGKTSKNPESEGAIPSADTFLGGWSEPVPKSGICKCPNCYFVDRRRIDKNECINCGYKKYEEKEA
jgi:hypothetical protein